jgi:uncharacterized RDD family membrane protein YckC
MKCPKCAYLGFDTGDRCRNCGYDFSLIATEEPAAELSLRLDEGRSDAKWPGALDRGFGPAAAVAVATPPAIAVAPSAAPATPVLDLAFEPAQPPPSFRGEPALPLFRTSATDDEPLIKVPSAPRAPLAVRRTPDLPKLRATPKAVERVVEPKLDFAEDQPAQPLSPPVEHQSSPTSSLHFETTGPVRRLMAAVLDYAILFTIDAVVLYLTLRIASLTMGEWQALPLLPMITFLGLLKLSYFTAFTCVGGQTIGKMAVNIRVLGDDDRPLDAAHAVHRALAGAVSFFLLGAGFMPALFGADRRALHDRLAHTRVVTLPNA